jgi:pilus assembly protein CpaB
MGTLSLSLRSIADNTADLERAVASGEIKVPANANPAQEKQMLLAMSNRPSDSNTTYTTGGDVSRFQRRTLPVAPITVPAGSLSSGPSGLSPRAIPARVIPVIRVTRGKNTTEEPVGN